MRTAVTLRSNSPYRPVKFGVWAASALLSAAFCAVPPADALAAAQAAANQPPRSWKHPVHSAVARSSGPARHATEQQTAPPAPIWPANSNPDPATVIWNSSGLRVQASNSSLRQILDDVATATGTKLEGTCPDQRVFGEYGPAAARDVVLQLLSGSGCNVLLVGDQGHGTPREIVLTPRSPGNPAANSYQVAPPEEQVENPESPDEEQPTVPHGPVPQPRFNYRPGMQLRPSQQIPEQMRERQTQTEPQNGQQEQPDSPQD